MNYPSSFGHEGGRAFLWLKRTTVLIVTLIIIHGRGMAAPNQPGVGFTLSLKNAPLTAVFSAIEKQSTYRFFYLANLLKTGRPVSINVKEATIEKVLDECLNGQPFEYKIEDHSVLISPKKAEPRLVEAAAVKETIPTVPVTDVRGKVTDSLGSPIIGATVLIKGTRQGTTTKHDGSFNINANAGETLEISMLGYKTRVVKVDANTAAINIILELDVSKLTDVVVVGYGTQKKRDLTGSVSSISNDQMNLGGVTSNAAQAIQGRAAGVLVSQSNAAPGGQTIVRIRGGNSIKSTNEPLYVVDGFPSETGKDINPNDIDDIQILKDASATAIYGARGANGVVLITTKRGKAGKAAIQYDGYYGVQKIFKGYDKMTGLEDMQVTNAKAIEKGNPAFYSAADLGSGISNNWFDLATRVASVQSHNLSVSGGNEDTRVALSGNYFSQDGALRNTDYKRYSVRMNIDKQFSRKFKMGANMYGAHSFSHFKTYEGNIVPSNVMYGILSASPAIPAYNADGSFARFRGRDNPLAWLMAPTNDRYGNVININAYANYDITNDLSFRVNGGSEYLTSKEGTYIPRDLVDGEKVGGKASLNDLSTTRNLVEAYFTYKKSFGVHGFNVVAGVSTQSDVQDAHFSQVQKFSTDTYLYYNLGAASEKLASTSSRVQAKLASAYGRLNYSLKDKYLATFTLRRDGSSRFGANNRYGYFPSGSIAWRLSDEEFMKNIRLFSNLKLRAGYGITGNDRIGDYIYMTTFGPTNVSLGEGSDSYAGVVATRLPNPNLKWESTAQLNVGLDMGFLDGRITATVDYYKKKTKDLLLDIPIGDWQGFNVQTVNAGAIENKGVELSITTENIHRADMKWNSTFNIAYNMQKCLDLGGRPYIITQTANPYGGRGVDFTKLVPGKELSTFYGFLYNGVIKTGETYAPQPDSKPGDPKYVDVSGPAGKPDGLITADDRTYLGNANPHYIFGFNNDFSYKGLELNVFFQGAMDYSLYNVNHLILESGPGKEALNRWTPTNQNTDIPRDGYAIKYGGYVNSRFIENASYLRCKMITLGYNFPIKNTFLRSVKNVKAYASVQNLFTITGYTGSDPEVNTRGGDANLAAGLDYTAFPAFRSYTFGLKLNF